MSADEKLWRVFSQLMDDSRVIARRIAADMGHEHPDSFRLPPELFGIEAADILAVDITKNAAKGSEAGQLFGELGGAEIPGVPDLVARLEVMKDRVIEKVVRIG